MYLDTIRRKTANLFYELFRSPLFNNAWYLFGVNTFPALAGLIFWILAARLYPASAVGIASVVFSIVTLLSWISGLGTNIGLIRFISESQDSHRMINSVLNLNIVMSILSVGGFLLGGKLWAGRLQYFLNSWSFILVFISFVLVSTLGTTIRDSFVAYRKSNYAFFFTVSLSVLRILLLIGGIYFGVLGLIGSTMVAFLVTYLISVYQFMPRVSSGFHRSYKYYGQDIGPMLPFSLSNSVVIFMMQITQTILPLMTLELLGANENAFSYIALMLGISITLPGLALAMSAFAEGSNNLAQSTQILRKAFIASMAITIAGSMVLLIIAPWLLSLFGSDYTKEGTSVLRWMSFAAPFIVINQIYFTYARLQKQLEKILTLSFILMVIIVGVAYFLMPFLGIQANGIAMLIGNLIVTILVITTWINGKKKGKHD
jgi:O-antigen/teichoic acid export membrane protein